MTREIIYYGGVPVPWTVSWTAEAKVFLGRCPHARGRAICQEERRGEGKPQFGAPHSNRQRQAIACGLCDLCGKPLKLRTKVSLSQARSIWHAAKPGDILQVEPLLHRECARECMNHCPALKRQLREGTLRIRQVTKWNVQFAIYSEQGVFEACGERVKAVSHAKVHLLRWFDRDLDWLCGGVAS